MTVPHTPSRTTRDYQQLDAAHHIHAFVDQKALNAEGPRVMVRGEGLQLWDNDGQRYLDGMSGLWCTALGYGRADLNAAKGAGVASASAWGSAAKHWLRSNGAATLMAALLVHITGN